MSSVVQARSTEVDQLSAVQSRHYPSSMAKVRSSSGTSIPNSPPLLSRPSHASDHARGTLTGNATDCAWEEAPRGFVSVRAAQQGCLFERSSGFLGPRGNFLLAWQGAAPSLHGLYPRLLAWRDQPSFGRPAMPLRVRGGQRSETWRRCRGGLANNAPSLSYGCY